MATTTAIYGWPVPELTDSPNAPQQFSDLADAIETTVASAGVSPIGDSTNSVYLTAGIDFTANNNKNILATDITLTRDQWVILSGHAAFLNTTGGASGQVGIYIDLGGGTPIPQLTSGYVWMGASGNITELMQLSLPAFSVFLTAGAHTVRLRGDRDSTAATHRAIGNTTANVTMNPCKLTIIV